MKISYTILFLFLFHCLTFSQDTIKNKNVRKFQFAITTNGYYKYFLGKRYIQPTPRNPTDDFTIHQFERFTKIPTTGFQGGFLLSYKVCKNWSIVSGLMYIMRKDNYSSNYDSVITYNATYSYGYNNIHNVVKYNYSYSNLELPIMIQYSIKKFNFYGGIHFPILTYEKASYTYLPNSNQYPFFSDTGPTAQKTFQYFIPHLNPFPTLQVSYDFNIKRIYLSPFVEIDFGAQKSFYLHGGIIIPLKLKKRNE